MSVMVLFGIATLAVLGLLVAVFVAVFVVRGPSLEDDAPADDDTIDKTFSTHGVHMG
ncbi:hypothetical protein [Streptomonospora wellingtoniae]|uniref:Uncharacterized protein n=1 Tax=Streptomonospora wellingtoniae TaxID=3075544 RepID=A0ABU2KX41_9ACTN|nr:hypothetical protein [Streptomonospora sp. DSM 45055]MDT0303864.1 hypothetical protein [Streptomonospora sp. DSM 45055]